MPRPTEIRRTKLAQAIRRFRLTFPDTQQEFAQRLGLSVVSVARYETNSQPSKEIKKRLADLARQNGLLKYVELFEGRKTPEATLDREELASVQLQFRLLRDKLADGKLSMQRAKIILAVVCAPEDVLPKVERLLAGPLEYVESNVTKYASYLDLKDAKGETVFDDLRASGQIEKLVSEDLS